MAIQHLKKNKIKIKVNRYFLRKQKAYTKTNLNNM